MKKTALFFGLISFFFVFSGHCKKNKNFDCIVRKVDTDGITTYSSMHFKNDEKLHDYEHAEKKKLRKAYSAKAKEYKKAYTEFRKNRKTLEEPAKPNREKIDILNKKYSTNKEKKDLKEDLKKYQKRAKKKNDRLRQAQNK